MDRNTRLYACALFVVTLCSAAFAAEKKPEPLIMRLSGPVTPAGSDVLVRLRVEPNVRSRELTIVWMSDELAGSHGFMLNGDRAAVTHQFPLKNLVEGEYVVAAILRLDDGTEIRRTGRLLVVGSSVRGTGSGSTSGPFERKLRAGKR